MNIKFCCNGESVTIKADPDDFFYEAVMKYLSKIHKEAYIEDMVFYFKSQPLNIYDGKTLNEYNMYDNAEIQVEIKVVPKKEKIKINIIFIKDRLPFYMEVFLDDLFIKETSRFFGIRCSDIHKFKFTFDSFPLILDDKKSFNDYSLYNNAIIKVYEIGKMYENKENKDIIFNIYFLLNERIYFIDQIKSNCKFCELIKIFRIKADCSKEDKFEFSFGDKTIKEDEQEILKELKIYDNSIIKVIKV